MLYCSIYFYLIKSKIDEVISVKLVDMRLIVSVYKKKALRKNSQSFLKLTNQPKCLLTSINSIYVQNSLHFLSIFINHSKFPWWVN